MSTTADRTLMTPEQKAAYNLGYLQAIADLLEQSKKTPLLNQEHLIRALNDEVQRMRKLG